VLCCCSNVTYLDKACNTSMQIRSVAYAVEITRLKEISVRNRKSELHIRYAIDFCSTAANKVYGVTLRGIPVSQKYRCIKCEGIRLYTVGLFTVVYRLAIFTINTFPIKHNLLALCILLYFLSYGSSPKFWGSPVILLQRLKL